MAIVFFALVIFSFVALHIGKYEYFSLKADSMAFQTPNSEFWFGQITWDAITGVRYGMQHRHLLN